jgi:hypothetical protein
MMRTAPEIDQLGQRRVKRHGPSVLTSGRSRRAASWAVRRGRLWPAQFPRGRRPMRAMSSVTTV